MPAPLNRFKIALSGDRPLKGIWLTLASPAIAELAGNTGLDWLLIDGEHAPNTLTSLQAQLQAIEGTTASPIVRLPMAQPWLVKQVLDLGAQSLLFPMIHTAEDAAAAVASCRYPPHGVRGIGATIARASGWGREADYIQTADAQICVVVQAESRSAVDNIDDIAAVEGVDCVFIGPADLAADMGHTGNPAHPEVQEAISHMIDRIKSAGKAPGLFGSDPNKVEDYLASGVRMLAVGTDSLLLSNAMRELGK